LLVALVVFSGCRTELKPDGLPPLYPASITVTSEGAPVAGVFVNLVPEDPVERWTAAGTTGQNGVVTLRTYARYPGSPAGKFKVVLTKTEVDGANMYQLINNKYTEHATSELEFEVVPKGKNSATFDIGKLVRDLIKY